MNIIVQKFGGTSVSTEERRNQLVTKVKNAIENGMNPVVVVSAMGRKGDPYATDTLLSLINKEFMCENKKAQDLLMSCGEIISSVVVCNSLYNAGIDAVPLTGGQAGIITDDNFTDARFLSAEPEKILSIINSGKVPVITGFQGITDDGYFTTLGRGGSDTSACILGAALNAIEIEIYTDVDGIMTADPRMVRNPSLIDKVTYNEVYQLADQGAKVIHPKAVNIAKKANIPLFIKNTMSDCDGTLIVKELPDDNKKFITGITHLNNRVQVRVRLSENPNHAAYRSLLDILAKNDISLDLINIFPAHQIFTVEAEEKEKLKCILNKAGINFSTIDNCSTIAIVGTGMTGVPGIMAQIVNTLNENEIEVLQTTDSNITIWCLVYSDKVSEAVNVLHKKFGL